MILLHDWIFTEQNDEECVFVLASLEILPLPVIRGLRATGNYGSHRERTVVEMTCVRHGFFLDALFM